MDFKGIRVLILEGYARQSLPLIKAFHKLGCYVAALCSSKLDVAYASRYTDEKILGVCDRSDVKATTGQVRKLLKTGKYDVVVPTVDFSAALLSENKIEFTQYTKVVSNDWNVYQIAGDKVQTMAVCMEEEIPCPYTVLNATTIEQVLKSEIEYPIVVKPRVGYGAIGFRKIDSKEELKTLFADGLDPSIYVFQEFIPQIDLQYECAMFVDNDNQVKTSLVFSKNRWFPVNGGSSTLNITVERPDIVESCTSLLQAINWRGPADIDLIQDPRDNTAKIMEINPRVSGSVKICFVSGVDQARQMLELVYGQEVTKHISYTIGQRLRCSQTDVLWFLKSPNRFKSKPSWFSVRKTKDHIFAWDDPLPWFSYSLQAILRYKSEMKKRQGDSDK
ncbi:MAG: ATP-grasp domain-containing protein [Tissierellia bacterium]|nr:ATP-grasp domain-containing protein [Tissierellia bacterium]